jgi:hypothetical protein
MKAEVLARFSSKTIAWGLLWIAVAIGIWRDFYIHGRHVLDGRWGALWLVAALASAVMGPWAAWLLARALLPGAAAIIKRGDNFVCFLPWRIVIRLQDVERIEASEYGSAIGLPRQVVSGPQVEVLLHSGKSIKIRTPLLKESAEVIATRMVAVLQPVSEP